MIVMQALGTPGWLIAFYLRPAGRPACEPLHAWMRDYGQGVLTLWHAEHQALNHRRANQSGVVIPGGES